MEESRGTFDLAQGLPCDTFIPSEETLGDGEIQGLGLHRGARHSEVVLLIQHIFVVQGPQAIGSDIVLAFIALNPASFNNVPSDRIDLSAAHRVRSP